MKKDFEILLKLLPARKLYKSEIEKIIKRLIKKLNKLLIEVSNYQENTEKIIELTYLNYNLDPKKEILLKKCRGKEISKIKRFLTFYLKQQTKLTLKEIGYLLKKDHSTILYRINEVRKTLSFENPEKNEYLEYEKFLNELL